LRLRGKQPFSTREPDPDHTGGGMHFSKSSDRGIFSFEDLTLNEGTGSRARSKEKNSPFHLE